MNKWLIGILLIGSIWGYVIANGIGIIFAGAEPLPLMDIISDSLWIIILATIYFIIGYLAYRINYYKGI